MQNGYVERFNDKLRDECLNGHWVLTLGNARRTLEEWRMIYKSRSGSTVPRATCHRREYAQTARGPREEEPAPQVVLSLWVAFLMGAGHTTTHTPA